MDVQFQPPSVPASSATPTPSTFFQSLGLSPTADKWRFSPTADTPYGIITYSTLYFVLCNNCHVPTVEGWDAIDNFIVDNFDFELVAAPAA